MQRLDSDAYFLDYDLHPGGEPVVFIHAAPFVSWYSPLVERMDAFATLRYRRVPKKNPHGGYNPLTVEEDAAICAGLMDHVGWDTAHMVGHSYGALVALQLGLSIPDRIASMALLEPAARGISSAPQVAISLEPVISAYRGGDGAGAMDRFLRHVGGDDCRLNLDQALPDAFNEAVENADIFFQAEMPAVTRWRFGPEEASRVTQPVLNVLGAHSVSRFVEGSELIQSWFPDAERMLVPNATHLLMVQNPDAVAEGLGQFFTRHPVAAASTTH